MRLPYLQVTQETWGYARQLAGLLGCSEGDAFKAICDLWAWGLSLGPEDQPPTGLCENERAARLLPAALGWKHHAAELVQALADLDLIEVRPNGHIRVRGMERYAAAFEADSNRRERWRRANEKRRLALSRQHNTDSTAPIPRGNRDVTELLPLPETQTQTHIKKDFLEPQKPAAPKRERRLSAAEEFFAWLSARRQQKTTLSDEPTSVAGINAAFGRALTAIGRPALEARYLAYLDEPDGASQEPPWPWRRFLARYPYLKAAASQQPLKVLSATERRDLYGAQSG